MLRLRWHWEQWIYQSCNEFGYFQTTANAGTSPFSAFAALDADAAGAAVCDGAFGLSARGLGPYTGPKANAAGPLANTEYGARRVAGLNITMPNGTMPRPSTRRI